VERGRHLALTRGCFGCHGRQLEGSVYEGGLPKRSVAPNLLQFARSFEPSVFDAAVRFGIGHDGRALWSMPSYNFRRLDAADSAALFAYFRSEEPVDNELPAPRLGWRVRWSLVSGEMPHMAQLVAEVPDLRFADGRDRALARGEYLAMTSCNECHGLDLRGTAWGGFFTPDLAVISAYSLDDFTRLMRDGIATGGRNELQLMSAVARDRFVHLTDDEVRNLYEFLGTLVKQPIPANVSWRQAD